MSVIDSVSCSFGLAMRRGLQAFFSSTTLFSWSEYIFHQGRSWCYVEAGDCWDETKGTSSNRQFLNLLALVESTYQLIVDDLSPGFGHTRPVKLGLTLRGEVR